MARWSPPDKIGPNEMIGRRLFEEPMLRGAAGQPSYSGIPLYHFEEKRSPETSVDRLGATGVDRKVKGYLLPRAQAAGEGFQKPKGFDGWAIVQAKHLTQKIGEQECSCVASPVKDAEPKDNLYHAHVERPDSVDYYFMALHLRNVFTSRGTVELVNPAGEAPRNWLARAYNASTAFLVGLLGRLTVLATKSQKE